MLFPNSVLVIGDGFGRTHNETVLELRPFDARVVDGFERVEVSAHQDIPPANRVGAVVFQGKRVVTLHEQLGIERGT